MLQNIDLSIVVPVLNEEEALPFFFETLIPILEDLEISYEIVVVDDGSTDKTADIVRHHAKLDRTVRLVQLSRNFGKEAALTAGLDCAKGAAVIPMDVDLQDPPELIIDFVKLWRAGYDIVYGQRISRDADSNAKRTTAAWFYRIFNGISAVRIEPNVGDFRLMSRPVVDATRQLRERNRFMKGIFAWVGFRAVAVPYVRPERAAGQTKFNYWKLWNFAIDGLTSFSTAPLRVWTYVGLIVAVLAVIYMFVLLLQTLIYGREVPGYASLMIVVLMLGAVQIISLGIIGEYLGRLYIETKNRPIYIIQDTTELDEAQYEVAATGPEAVPDLAPDLVDRRRGLEDKSVGAVHG